MNMDFTALDTSIYVFIGTLLFGLALAAVIAVAALATLVLAGTGQLLWFLVRSTLGALVDGINFAWERLVHHAGQVELPADFQAVPGTGTGSYPRVALRDS
ncbi:hypothetical protein [Arthrobacter cupressi]|uniref:Uncharacterized protein n=1 Tax=Arthrobacter cupressi TaxID=1045773 RepID=A0A1G8XAU5_9MICC|nr:hypothetical protein [Arthrobacter cupressi]NYD77710.1 hypothetical protein [Arthrobacter cupressi]SDJ87426.1 hypothetical protein SAMN05216555_11854 [Arthrobacter cupressi]